MMMVKVNTVIQVSIVNQQYARAQALFLTYNSPFYPGLNFTATNDTMIDRGLDVMVLGVSDNIAPKPDEDEPYEPKATKLSIIRSGADAGDDSDPEPQLRGRIRVRTSVALCTKVNSFSANGGNRAVSAGNYPEQAQFGFCKGSFSSE